MIIIHVCPRCGRDLYPLIYATYPPIHALRCFSCGWEHEEKPEPIKRVPFSCGELNT